MSNASTASGTSLRGHRLSRLFVALRPGASLHGQYAGFASRGLGSVIDMALISVITVATLWVINAILALVGADLESCPAFVALTGLQALLQNLCRTVRGAEYVFIFTLPFAYFVFFWWLSGQTVGMAIAGVKVVCASVQPLTVGVTLLRLVGYILSILPLGLGFLWVLGDERRQGWHDKLAGTYVIYWHQPGRAVAASPEPASPIPSSRRADLLEMHDRQ